MSIEKINEIHNNRILLIDLMQGMAMIMVVIGHHMFTFMPRWYEDLHTYIYLFHMPFFMFISGFLIRYSYKGVSSVSGYLYYVGRKAKKFVPYILLVRIIMEKWKWIGIVGLIIFVFLSFLHFHEDVSLLSNYFLPWISIPALAYLVSLLGHRATIRQFFTFISVNCFGIYLLHMFFVQAFAFWVCRWSGMSYTFCSVGYLILSSFFSMLLASFCWKSISCVVNKKTVSLKQ
jgi:fucose 4-O-acetylase-like acetyltransferase